MAARRGCPIDRTFSMQGFGTVVTGTLISGRVRPDDELALVPGGRRVRVRGVQVHGRRTRDCGCGAAHGGQSRRHRSGRDRSRAGAGDARSNHGDAPGGCGAGSAAVSEAAQARGARPLPSGHDRGDGSRLDCRVAGNGDCARIARDDPASTRIASRAHARRSIHPARVLADGDDRWRTSPRPRTVHGRPFEPRRRRSDSRRW